jgi:hypothetical protein
MKRLPCVLAAFILATTVTLAARQKRLTGKISDLAAFGDIRTYCVDTTDLPGWEALDVRNLVETESKQRRLLTKLPWKLAPDCSQSQPDAVVVVRFPIVRVARVDSGTAAPDPNEDPQSRFFEVRAELQVSDRNSSRLLYEVQAAPVFYSSGRSVAAAVEPDHVLRREAAYHAFWALIDDIKRVSQISPK